MGDSRKQRMMILWFQPGPSSWTLPSPLKADVVKSSGASADPIASPLSVTAVEVKELWKQKNGEKRSVEMPHVETHTSVLVDNSPAQKWFTDELLLGVVSGIFLRLQVLTRPLCISPFLRLNSVRRWNPGTAPNRASPVPSSFRGSFGRASCLHRGYASSSQWNGVLFVRYPIFTQIYNGKIF